ncbi:MAG: sulfotransferase [Litorimonas sp.]
MPQLTLISGLNLLRQKAYKAVHIDSVRAIENDVGAPVPYFLLGVLAFDHQNYGKALELFKRARRLDPSEIYFPAYEAMVLSTLRRSNEARLAADTASEIIGQNAHLRDMLGVVYSRCGFHEKAIVHFKEAVKLNKSEPNYFYNLAASLQFLGNFEAAKAAYRSVLDLNPSHHRAWSSYVSLDKQTEENNHLQTLKELFRRPSSSTDAKLHFGHAIAKTLEDMNRHEASLTWLKKAKTEKRTEFPFDRSGAAAVFKAATKHKEFSGQSGTFDQKTVPIFVVGLPRTGTTLVDRILSSHSQVTSAGELDAFAEQIKILAGTNSPLVLDAETLEAAGGIAVEAAAEAYLSQTELLAAGSPFMVDKMPLNFFYGALIARAFPKVKIIALRRGAMDSCLSNFRQLFSTQFSYYNYTFDLDDTAFFYRLFDDLMAHWRETLPADRFMEIHYEDIVHDQVNQTRKLLDFCDLDFEEACLRFHENTAAVSTASSVQVRQPLYSGSIGRWKKYGNKLDDLNTALKGLVS